MNIANGCDLTGMDCIIFQESFDTPLSFPLLYDFLKSHKQYKWNRDIPHESCTCEICENLKLYVEAVNTNLKKKSKKLRQLTKGSLSANILVNLTTKIV